MSAKGSEMTQKRPTVVSVEQALSMPYATLRFVHLGWRVIRVEPTPFAGRKSKGDPNRYIGRSIAGEDRHSYYVAPNVGKEAIALNLKSLEGQAALHTLLDELEVDVFCTNTLPSKLAALGIDPATLCEKRPSLIWAGISAMGHDHPKVPGYDPVMQALCGFMDLTGEANGPPTQCGPPITDLKAGDEVFAQVMLGLYERSISGKGKVIDVSMARCAASWLNTFTPMLEMGSEPDEIRRNGNEHRQFIPTNAYPTRDGFIYLAIGSDVQWARLVATDLFAPLRQAAYATNEGRRADKSQLHARMAKRTQGETTAHVTEVLKSAGIPHAPITPIEEVADLPFVRATQTTTTSPNGQQIRLPPAAVETDFLRAAQGQLAFAPRYGEHTRTLLHEAGFTETQIDALVASGMIAGPEDEAS